MANVEKEGCRQVINNSERFMLLRKRSCLQFSIVPEGRGGGRRGGEGRWAKTRMQTVYIGGRGRGKLFSLARTSNAADKRG